ncbi:hypothetical protein [Shivajiella indica]|uniref:SGNH/GDSL hydrolase family protein n=1 Tax=Shivajiella indica TaxID=872115 RepID=A0ABW5BBI9_9BACT
MREFVFKILGFGLLPLIFLLPPFYILNNSGESFVTKNSFDKLIQSNRKYLIGYFYDESNYEYLKWKEIQIREKLDVMVIGTSRVLQFREDMFTNASFFNAGTTKVIFNSISDYLPFLRSIGEDKYPKVLIIGLDQFMFNSFWDPLQGETSLETKIPYKAFPASSSLKNVYEDLLNGRIDLETLFPVKDEENIAILGLNANVNKMGYRKDGSMLYGKQIEKLMNGDSTAGDFGFKFSFQQIEDNEGIFKHGMEVNPRSLNELNKLLDFCKNNGIYVIAYLPPYADAVNAVLESSGNYQYMEQVMGSIEHSFEINGFELWNMRYLSTFGSNDDEMLDGFHGGAVTKLRMIIFLLENGSKLNEYTDLNILKNDLKNRKNRYLVYDY